MNQQECCPDLGFLIVFPSYHAGGIPGTGHAAAVVVNGRTGELKGYDFGPDDHVHKQAHGYVNKYNYTLALSNDCLPNCDDLSYIMLFVSNEFGIDRRHNVLASGDIQGVHFRMISGSYEKSIAYAEDRARINEEYERQLKGENIPQDERLDEEYQYRVSSYNCMTFALSVLSGEKFGRPVAPDWPANDISLYQWLADKIGAGTKFSYKRQAKVFQCDGCCKKIDSREDTPTPEQMGGIPIGDGLYYYEDPLSDL